MNAPHPTPAVAPAPAATPTGPVELVARLSDTCSACRWAVPGLNALEERLVLSDGSRPMLVAEISGDGERFVDDTGLIWPTRPWTTLRDDRRERLPNLLVREAGGRIVTRIEAEEFDQLDGAVGDLLRLRAPAPITEQRDALAERLGSITRDLTEHGYLRGDVAWCVSTSEAPPELEVAAELDAAILMTPRTARRLLDDATDPVDDIVKRELSVFGDADIAARALTGVAAGARWIADYAETLPSPADRDERGARRPLPRTPPPVAVIACLRLYSPVARRIALRVVWEYGRAVSELEANDVFAVFAELGECCHS